MLTLHLESQNQAKNRSLKSNLIKFPFKRAPIQQLYSFDKLNHNLTNYQAFLLRIKELKITSLRCFDIMLQFVISRIIWMQYFFYPYENFGFRTTKKQSPYLSSKVVPYANAGILPDVRLILPQTQPVPSLKRNMFALFYRLKFSSLPIIDIVQKLCPSKLESSFSQLLSWQRVRGTIARSLTGLYSFFAEYAIGACFNIYNPSDLFGALINGSSFKIKPFSDGQGKSKQEDNKSTQSQFPQSISDQAIPSLYFSYVYFYFLFSDMVMGFFSRQDSFYVKSFLSKEQI